MDCESIPASHRRVLVRAAQVMTMTRAQGTIAQGGVLVGLEAGKPPVIEAVGRADELLARYDLPVIDGKDALLIPGLINCHTHLELSHLADRTCPGKGFTPWAVSLHPLMQEPVPPEAMRHALARMRETGTVLAADMSGYQAPLLAALLEDDPLPDVFFLVQRMGFAPPKGASLRPYAFARGLEDRYLPVHRFSYAGHALYSTHPATLQQTKRWCETHNLPFALHLAESLDEVALLRDGSGPLTAALKGSGLLPAWFAPVGKTPVAYAHELGLLGPRTLAVHCVHVDAQDVALLAATGTSVCLCPGSNACIGVGAPPVRALYEAGVTLCLGTDGLSSNNDLDLLHELHLVRQHLPCLDVEQGLRMVTTNAARILGVAADYGSLEPGKKACMALLNGLCDRS